MVMLLELDRVVPAIENHPSPRRMTESQGPDIVLRLEERYAATILYILRIGPAQIGAVAAYLADWTGNLVQQGFELRGIATFPRGKNRRIDELLWLAGFDGKMQLLEVPAMDLLPHSHI